MTRTFIAALLAAASTLCAAATTAVVTPGAWTLYRGTAIVQPRVDQPSLDACVAQAKAIGVERAYTCRSIAGVAVAVTADPPPTCITPQPATETRTQACPSGTTGEWSQTRTYAQAAYPTCWTAGAWAPASAPAGACVTPPPPPPPPPVDSACTTTLSPGANIAAALSGAAANAVVCLNAGNYGTVQLYNINRSSRVTLRSASGTGATINPLPGASQNITFQSLTVGYALQDSCSRNIHWVGNRFTGTVTLTNQGCTNLGAVFDGNTFGAASAGGGYEGRLSLIYGSGITIKNNTFGPGGASDGIFMGGQVSNVQIGPGNLFTGIAQSSCGNVHCDAVQGYGAGSGIVIEGNRFEKGDTFIMMPDGSSGVVVRGNEFDGTGIGYTYKLQFGSARNLVFTGNTVRNASVAIDSKTGQPASTGAVATGNTMIGSHFKTSGGNGCTGCTIQGN